MQGFFFLDVDTQRDFMSPGGALYVPGAERLVPKIRRIFDFAKKFSVFVLSSADAHRPDDAEFQEFPPHCVSGTEGQKKLDETLLPRNIVLENRPHDRNLLEIVKKYPQAVIQKQALDVFTNPVTSRLLKVLPERAIVFGVTTEFCVRHAVLGLRRSGVKTAIITDAIAAVDASAGSAALQEMQAAGAELITLESLLGTVSR